MMADQDVIRAVEHSVELSQKVIVEKLQSNLEDLRTKTIWERWQPWVQSIVVLAGVGWASFTYYMDRHDKAMQPANITVQPTLEDQGVHDGLRFVKVQIAVLNQGHRAYVINSAYTVRAHKLNKISPRQKLDDKPPLWDGSFENDVEQHILRSGEAFGRGFWFEPGERDVRTYIVAVPEGKYNSIDIDASVRHAKVMDDAVHTRWEQLPDHSLNAIVVVNDGTKKEDYLAEKHESVWKRDAIAMNDGHAQISIWPQNSQPTAATGKH